jgi:hypothetical protein
VKGKHGMSMTKVPYGKPVKLLADYQGYPDGRVVQFEIWRKKTQGEEKVTELNGVTKGGKAYVMWNPDFGEYTVKLKANESEVEQVEDVKYYFVAKIDDKEVKSGDIDFTYSLDIYLEDADGKPLDGIEYTITLSDGSSRKGKFLGGRVALKDVPRGKFKVEIDGYSPNTLHGVVA